MWRGGIVMRTQIFRLLSAFLLLLAAAAAFGQAVPSAIGYQGKLTDGSGSPVPDGTYNLVFSLYPVATGGHAYWTSAVTPVQTRGGVFTTALEPIDEPSFVQRTDLYIETTVKGSPDVILTPRIKLLSAPFALRAGDVSLPFSGSINHADPIFDIENTGNGQAVKATTSRVGHAVDASASGTGDAIHAVTTGATGSRAGYFEINNASNASHAVQVTSNGPGNVVNAYTSGLGKAGYFEIANENNGSWALDVITNGTPGAIHAYSSGGGNTIFSQTTGTGRAGLFWIINQTNTLDALMGWTYGSGNAVYGHNTGTGRAGYFDINNASSSSHALEAETNGTGTALRATYDATGNYADLGVVNMGVYGCAVSAGGRGVSGNSTGSSGGYGVYGSASGTNSYAVYASNTGAGGVGVYAKGGSGGFAGVFRGNVQVQDVSTGASVVEFGTGLDYAEGFDVAGAETVEAGMVLVIDSAHPGKLTVSKTPYDRKVAGIVAGAKGLGSGVKLGAGQSDHNVALAGRVYCNVVATDEAIQPGDLLTTSATPGHAMKVVDYSRAQGAILGKAMESLDRGKTGQILVLVTLQ